MSGNKPLHLDWFFRLPNCNACKDWFYHIIVIVLHYKSLIPDATTAYTIVGFRKFINICQKTQLNIIEIISSIYANKIALYDGRSCINHSVFLAVYNYFSFFNFLTRNASRRPVKFGKVITKDIRILFFKIVKSNNPTKCAKQVYVSYDNKR